MVPLLLALSATLAVPLMLPVSVSGDVLLPLFLKRRLFAPSTQSPVLTTGVLASAAKLTPAPLTELVNLLGSVTVAPPEPSSGAKPATPRLMKLVPNDELLLKCTSVEVEERLVPPLYVLVPLRKRLPPFEGWISPDPVIGALIVTL